MDNFSTQHQPIHRSLATFAGLIATATEDDLDFIQLCVNMARNRCDILGMLSYELKDRILSFCPISTLGRMAQVCHTWNNIVVESTEVWRRAYFIHTHLAPLSTTLIRSSTNYLDHVMQCTDCKSAAPAELGSLEPNERSVSSDRPHTTASPLCSPRASSSSIRRHLTRRDSIPLHCAWMWRSACKTSVLGKQKMMKLKESRVMPDAVCGSPITTLALDTWGCGADGTGRIVSGEEDSHAGPAVGDSIAIVGHRNSTVSVWHIGLRCALFSFRFNGCSALHADGNGVVFLGSYQGIIAKFYLAPRREMSPVLYVGHTARISCLASGTVDGLDVLVSGAADGTVRMWCRDSARCVSVWDHGSAAQHPTITALHVLRCEQHSAREGVADPLERTTAATSPSRPGGLHVLVSSRDRITHAVFTASCVPAHGHGATDAELHDTLYHGQELAMAHFACDEFVVSRHGVVTVGPCGLAYWKLPGLQQMWHVEAFVGTTLALGSAYMILACGKTCRLIDSNTLKELKVRLLRTLCPYSDYAPSIHLETFKRDDSANVMQRVELSSYGGECHCLFGAIVVYRE
eukprot:m.52812 g.52812  ORF g.52812 m.52812 type:complete len:575 (-) comp15430_c0_seq4:91-1815(-)